jgi:6,7-dimethyl-8-ribityllumazine synthase
MPDFMATTNQNLSSVDWKQVPDGRKYHIGIVVSEWNKEITSKLLAGCNKALVKAGVSKGNIDQMNVPGTFELPVGARMLSSHKKYDAIICIGCVIKGETKHDEYISNAVAAGLIQLGIMANLPVIFGVLTPNTLAQAKERAGGKHGNKGIEAAITALKMAAARDSFLNTKKKIGF